VTFIPLLIVHGCNKSFDSRFGILRGVLVRIVTHGTRLRVVVGAVGVKVAKILGSVFANAQVSNSDALLRVYLGARHVDVVRVFVFIFVLVSRIALDKKKR
jgi:hypothetical protein